MANKKHSYTILITEGYCDKSFPGEYGNKTDAINDANEAAKKYNCSVVVWEYDNDSVEGDCRVIHEIEKGN